MKILTSKSDNTVTPILGVRKEDDMYYQGPFWIIGDSFLDILRGKFQLLAERYECDFSGNYIDKSLSKSQRTHKKLWKEQYQTMYDTEDFTYYPRGRVAVYQGVAFIHINSKCNIPKIIDKVVNDYNLHKLEIEVDLNDTYQGSHYDFKLE